MSPALQNILVTILGFIYVFSVVWIMDLAVKKGLAKDVSRKIVHISAGSWLIFWVLYDPSHWTKYLNIAPAAIWTILLLIKGFTAKPGDEAVRTMTRTGDRKELLRGPLYFTLVMNTIGTIYFMHPIAALTMGALGWGDGLAPVIGKRFGKNKFKIFAQKTLEGSLAFLVFGLLGILLFQFVLFGSIDFQTAAIFSVVLTFVEAFSPPEFDNIFIPIFTVILFKILQII